MRILPVLCLTILLAPPAAAEERPADPAPPGSEFEQGFDLLGEGARLLFRGLMAEMEPALEEMGRQLAEMEPLLRQMAEMVGDIRNYHPPEKLPNGDIILRRKLPQPDIGPEGEVDL